MIKFVEPKAFLIGYTNVDTAGMLAYLQHTGNEDFTSTWKDAMSAGISPGEALCSFYAKLCYKSLTEGKNQNLEGVRGIKSNIESCFNVEHESVFEHCSLNFVFTGVSRVFTHELVRHRVGTAFSQTSGRYVRNDVLEFVMDPILRPVDYIISSMLQKLHRDYLDAALDIGVNDAKKFDIKKKLTSALRRILPNGQANEIGFTANIRALRHITQMRTSRHAEWEIRKVFAEVHEIVSKKFPLIFYGENVEMVDGFPEITFPKKAG